MIYHANTFQIPASFNPSVWVLSMTGYRCSLSVKSMPPCPIVWNGFVQWQDKPKVLVSGLQGRVQHTFAIFSLLPQFFAHLMCNQLDVWPLGITCHTDRPYTTGNRPLAWCLSLAAWGHMDFKRRSHGPRTPRSPVQFHQEPRWTASLTRSRAEALFL